MEKKIMYINDRLRFWNNFILRTSLNIVDKYFYDRKKFVKYLRYTHNP